MFKPVTALAAMEEHIVSPYAYLPCTGTYHSPHDTADQDTTTNHRPLCPCCGGRMIIVEIFTRGGTPRDPPSGAGIQT